MITQVRRRSRGTFDLAEGTVYPALHRLEQAALLESWWDSHEGRRRRVYRITPRGVASLADQRASYSRFRAGMRWGIQGA